MALAKQSESWTVLRQNFRNVWSIGMVTGLMPIDVTPVFGEEIAFVSALETDRAGVIGGLYISLIRSQRQCSLFLSVRILTEN